MKIRYVIVLALAIIVVLALTLFLVSKYIQPVLPRDLNADLLLFVVTLGAAAAFLAALKDVIELVERVIGRLAPLHLKKGDTSDGVSSTIREVGLEVGTTVAYEEFYSEEEFLRVSFGQEKPIYHVALLLNTQGLKRSALRFIHQGDFHISHPVFSELEEKVAARLRYNETRLRIARIAFSETPVEILCERASYSQVLITNHSEELTFDGKSLREVFAPSIRGKLCPLEDSLAANPAGCNCLLETRDNYFIIQKRSDLVETNISLYTPSVSGGTEYARPFPVGLLDPFLQLFLEMSEELGVGKNDLSCEPFLLAISRDVQRNGLPEFFFYARLKSNFSEVQSEIGKRRGRDSWEHRGVFCLPSREADILHYISEQQSSAALKANLAYYLKLRGVVQEWLGESEG